MERLDFSDAEIVALMQRERAGDEAAATVLDDVMEQMLQEIIEEHDRRAPARRAPLAMPGPGLRLVGNTRF